MATKAFKILKVTVEQLYLIPMIDEERTEINGRGRGQGKKDWCVNHNINRTHASRNGHEIGYSKKVVRMEEVEESILENYK